MAHVKKVSPRRWKVRLVYDAQPIRGKYKGQWITRELVWGRREAKEAWRLFWRLRGLGRHVELWRGRERVLPHNKP